MTEKNSIMFVGKYGLLFTDENHIIYNVHIDRHGNEGTLLKKGIVAINESNLLTEQKIEQINSKILSLTPDIKWEVK